MSLRATMETKGYPNRGYRAPDDGSGLALSASIRRILPAGVVFLAMVVASPVSAQLAVSGQASMRVGQVSQLDVDAYDSPTATPSGPAASTSTETLRIRVRANHAWKVVVAAGWDAGSSIWIRTIGAHGSSERHRLEPGTEAVVATGRGGATVVEIELEWDAGAYTDASSLPVTCTLASVDG